MQKKVLFVEPVDLAANTYLENGGYVVDIAPDNSVETVKGLIADYDAVLTRSAPFPAEVIQQGTKLKVIGRFGIGVDHIDMAEATRRGIPVVNAPTASLDSVAEQTAAMILALAKNIVRADKATRNNDWPFRNRELSSDVKGKTLGIIGLGKIGLLVAKKMHLGFDMNVIAYDPFVKSAPDYVRMTDLEDLMKTSDYVSVHSPATPETHWIINKETLSWMKPEAFVVNMARGSVVHEADLIEALKSGKIAGAALDVFEAEPPRQENELLHMDNVILSPHYAALSKETAVKMGLHAAQGIDEVLSGKQPLWCVNHHQLQKGIKADDERK